MKVTLLVNSTISGVSYAAGAEIDVSLRDYGKLLRLGACAEVKPEEKVVEQAAEEPEKAVARGTVDVNNQRGEKPWQKKEPTKSNRR